MRKRKPHREKQGSLPLILLKSALLGCVATVLLALLLAALLEREFLSMDALNTLTMIVKGLCAMLVGFVIARSLAHRFGVLFCGAGGSLYMLLSFLCFAIAERSFTFSWAMLGDAALAFAFGIIGSLISEFTKK